MKVYSSIQEASGIRNPVITVGTYDGVHKGHGKIIERLLRGAEEHQGESVILTFFPHPRMVLFPQDNDLKLLSTPQEKTDLLKKAGVQHLIIHPFTKDFSRLTAHEFIRDILVNQLHIKKIVIGYNHQFGRNREGTFEQLTEMSALHRFEVEEIPEQDVNHIAVSSTKIREALLKGEIKKAFDLSGHAYTLSGEVMRGKGLGKGLGFPTANISVAENYKLIPADGIYAVHVWVQNKKHHGMLYIGNRPVLRGTSKSIEAHLLEFDGDLYGQQITIEFRDRIRDDMNFNSLDDLTAQMKQDEQAAVKLLNR